MSDRPAPPPEGTLIAAALKRLKVSQREAAKRAEMSEGRWRQIVSGYQTVSGTRVPVRGPAETLARMAQVVGVTPEQLAEANRQDAAEALRELAPSPSPSVSISLPALAALLEETVDPSDNHLRHLLQIWPLLVEWQRRSLVGQAWYMAGSPPELRPADMPEETGPQRGTDEESRRTG